MRVNIVNQGGTSSGGFDIAGATLTGPLILAADPVAALEASTKQYVDNATNSLNASHIATGTLPVGRLPALQGEVTNIVGSNILTLNNTTVTPGTYPKVTVTGNGRVTAGSALSLADIPNLDWSKIVNNKPTTLAGYGITDGVKNTSDNVTGFVTAHANPTANTHAATKGYVDSIVSNSSVLGVGDTIRRTTATTPTGFLRCNGGMVSKTTYAALYAVVGDSFTISTTPGDGQPWKNQYAFNTTQTNPITGWGSAPGGLSDNLHHMSAVVTKNKVYLLGGYNNTTGLVSTIWMSTINADGTLNGGTWTNVGSLPFATSTYKAIVTKNRLYLIGGQITGGDTNKVITCAINLDGTLGTWTDGPTLPVNSSHLQALVIGRYVYLFSLNATPSIYKGLIASDGTIGAWTLHHTPTINYAYTQAAVIRNRVYLFGGFVSGAYNQIHSATISGDNVDNNWTQMGSLPKGTYMSHLVVTANRVYLFGGNENGVNSSAMQHAPINADGSLGAWTLVENSLPATLAMAAYFTTTSKIYTLGGTINNVVNSNIYMANFTGGLVDYSNYYNGTLTPVTDPNNFKLPDTLSTDPVNIYTYIKF